jgi:hypothetical protein
VSLCSAFRRVGQTFSGAKQDMVYVVKTIHGRRYRYWQESKRVAGKVKTTSVYIGPADKPTGKKNEKVPQKRGSIRAGK